MARTYTAAEALALPKPSPSNWIVEGLLRTGRGRPSLLCGFPESGKSTLSNQLAVAVANGTPFLGKNTQQGAVILWKAEDSPEDVSEDLSKAGMTASSEIRIIIPHEGDDSNCTNMQLLKAHLEKYPDTRLVIVETFQDFFEGVRDITSNDECKDALQIFRKEIITLHPDCAYLILHQFNKSNDDAKLSIKKILGGTALAAGTDAKIFLSQMSDADTRRVIHATTRKGKAIPQTYLRFDEETLTASLGDTVAVAKSEQKKEETRQKAEMLDTTVRQVIAENPGQLKSAIVTMIKGFRQDTVRKRIDELIEMGFIVPKLGSGKGNPILLFLPESDAEYLMQTIKGEAHANIA